MSSPRPFTRIRDCCTIECHFDLACSWAGPQGCGEYPNSPAAGVLSTPPCFIYGPVSGEPWCGRGSSGARISRSIQPLTCCGDSLLTNVAPGTGVRVRAQLREREPTGRSRRSTALPDTCPRRSRAVRLSEWDNHRRTWVGRTSFPRR